LRDKLSAGTVRRSAVCRSRTRVTWIWSGVDSSLKSITLYVIIGERGQSRNLRRSITANPSTREEKQLERIGQRLTGGLLRFDGRFRQNIFSGKRIPFFRQGPCVGFVSKRIGPCAWEVFVLIGCRHSLIISCLTLSLS